MKGLNGRCKQFAVAATMLLGMSMTSGEVSASFILTQEEPLFSVDLIPPPPDGPFPSTSYFFVGSGVTDINMSGQADLPLGNGYASVNTEVRVFSSPNPFSGMSGNLWQPSLLNPFDPLNGTSNNIWDLTLMISLKDIDPSNDFGGFYAGSEIVVPTGLPVGFLFDPFSPISYPYSNTLQFKTVTELGDINQNGLADYLKLTTIEFLALQSGFGTFNAILTLSGAVNDDITDPPFSITLNAPMTFQQAAPVPEPSTWLLLGSGLLSLGLWRRK